MQGARSAVPYSHVPNMSVVGNPYGVGSPHIPTLPPTCCSHRCGTTKPYGSPRACEEETQGQPPLTPIPTHSRCGSCAEPCAAGPPHLSLAAPITACPRFQLFCPLHRSQCSELEEHSLHSSHPARHDKLPKSPRSESSSAENPSYFSEPNQWVESPPPECHLRRWFCGCHAFCSGVPLGEEPISGAKRYISGQSIPAEPPP